MISATMSPPLLQVVPLNVESSIDDVMLPSTRNPIYCKDSPGELLTNMTCSRPRTSSVLDDACAHLQSSRVVGRKDSSGNPIQDTMIWLHRT
jgi:hypothetical protein